MNINPEFEARREGARQADGKFGTQEHAEAAAGTGALSDWYSLEAIQADSEAEVRAEEILGGPRSHIRATDALWRTVLWSSTDEDGVPLDTVNEGLGGDYDEETGVAEDARIEFTPEDINPVSRSKVEAAFNSWVVNNADAVKVFTETVADPDGGDPAEFLAHNWWLTKNGHGVGFRDRLADDPAYVEAVREAEERKRALVDAIGAVRDNNARVKAGITGAEVDLIQADHELEKITGGHVAFEAGEWVSYDRENWDVTWRTKGQAQRHLVETSLEKITPLRLLQHAAETAGDRYQRLVSGPGTGNGTPMGNQAAKEYLAAHNALRRAEALTALDKATSTSEYSVAVGDDGRVYVD